MSISSQLVICHSEPLTYNGLSNMLNGIMQKVTEFYAKKREESPNWARCRTYGQFVSMEKDCGRQWSSPTVGAVSSVQWWFQCRFAINDQHRALCIFPDSACDYPELGENITLLSLGAFGFSDELLLEIASNFHKCYFRSNDCSEDFKELPKNTVDSVEA